MNTRIPCKKFISLVYLTDEELSPQEALSLTNHLESCVSCKKIHDDMLAARRITVQLNAEKPAYPDFSASAEDITNSGTSSPGYWPQNSRIPGLSKTLTIVRYISGIAATILLFLFMWEQTTSVRKISMLENRVQLAGQSSSLGLIDRMTMARSVFTEKQWNDLAVGLKINPLSLDPHDLMRIKLLIENRIRLGETSELSLIRLFRNSAAGRRNVIILKNLIK